MRVLNEKKCILFVWLCLTLFSFHVNGQSNADSTFKPSGKLWGYAFGDYYYKAHSDPLNRGGANQYTGIEQGRNAFQFRRIYLGYNYNISRKFVAEMLLAAEDNVTTTTLPNSGTSGDLLTNNKLTYYIKLANIRWKNLWKGTDLVVGQLPTPAFAQGSALKEYARNTQTPEEVWGYRSIERTVSDIRRTPSYDFGAALQGWFDSKGNFGYDLMVGNGTSAKPENDKFKWFYGDVYAKFLDQKLIVDLYADYERLNWKPGFHHARNMLKGFVAYTTPSFTIGVEPFVNFNHQDVAGMHQQDTLMMSDTLNARATAISMFVRGAIIPNKLGYFARYDRYNPNTKYNDSYYQTYKGFSSTYEPNNKEQFITVGLDYTPVKNVHFMPNIWYNRYASQRSGATGNEAHDYDLVYRVTFYYVYGK